MKVLELIHGLGVGGAERLTADLCRHLRKRGREVEIGCLDELGSLGEELREEGFPVHLFGRRPGFDPRLPFRIARRVRRSGISVVHAQQYTAFAYAALAGLLSPRRLVYSEHGVHAPADPVRRRRFDRLFGRRASAITAVSSSVRDRMIERWALPDRIEVLPNGVDCDRFAPPEAAVRDAVRRELGLPDGAFAIGFVGRLEPVKNVALLLRAVARLRHDAHLVVVGGGSEREELEALASRLGLVSRVRFTGPRHDVERLLAAFDLFATVSLFEGSPLALLEAAAAGVPVVASSVGGVGETFEDGREAWLLAGEPPDGRELGEDGGSPAYLDRLVTVLAEVLDASDERARRGERALRRVRRERSPATTFDRYLELLEGRPARRPRC